jgi:RNA polymerase sigma-70 factor (ECF subfamily)
VPEPTDGELIRASLEDPAAFEGVFERHYDVVRRYAQRRVGVAAGEEVAARAFLVAFERRSRFRPSASGTARPWLLGIATNILRHHVRDERTHLRIVAEMPGPDAPTEPDDEDRLDAIAMGPAIAAALAALPARHRDALLLHVLAGLGYDEIAEALGIQPGTVRSRIHRARVALRERLGGLAASPGDDVPWRRIDDG